VTTDTTALGSRGARSALTGAASGAFSSLTGVGGGAGMIPLLTGPLRLTPHRAHATSIATTLISMIETRTAAASEGT
jgi:uncharacterized membrane protein YfcA